MARLERRRSIRREVSIEATAYPSGDPAPGRSAVIRNVGSGGLYWTWRGPPLEQGRAVRIKAGTALWSRCLVRFSRSHAPGVQGVGAEFERPGGQGDSVRSPRSPWELRLCSSSRRKRLQADPRLRPILRLLEEAPQTSLTLGKAARIADLERSYFSTYFHKHVGVTFKQWLQASKVERAAKLIHREDKGLASICEQAGFGDPRTLQRNFQRHLGLTPSQFRSLSGA